MWSAHPHAPVSVDVTPDRAAVVWGDAILAGDAGRAGARTVAASWSHNDAMREVYDGYHAAAVAAFDGSVLVGADVLGLFPVYYAAFDNVLLVGASPEPFRLHPAFRSIVSLEGMLAVLMASGPFHGQCLLDNVKRLSAGRLLQWRPGGPPREIVQYDMPTGHPHAALSFDDQVDLLFHVFARTVRRHHPPDERHGILLSGGRDSRLLAGCLAAQGSHADALTLGLPNDHEVVCASSVARALGFRHYVAKVPDQQFVDYASRSARWEHLAGGMGTIHTWGFVTPSNLLPARSGNGYHRSREVSLAPGEFRGALRQLTLRSIHPDTLRSLVLGAEGRTIIDGLVARLHASYHALGDDPDEAGWRLRMETYHRFYNGGVPWRLSFGSWPVMELLDREFLEAWIGIPIAVLADRGIIEVMLARRFPRLARLPLDRNANSTRPIAPSRAYRVREWISYRLPRAGSKQSAPMVERRQYFRQYDIDSPGWRAVRLAAEPHRARLAEWFDMDIVNRLLPPATERANIADPMSEGFEAKSLLGLMLWMNEHSAVQACV